MADKYLKSSATPLNWGDDASWDPSGVPQANDNVYIQSNSASLNINVATDAVSLFIVNGNYAGTISVDNQLDVKDVAQLGGADVRYEGSANISVAGIVYGTTSADAWANYTGKVVHDGTSGTPPVGSSGQNYLPDFEVNPGGAGCTPTAQVDLSLGSFTGTSGAFDDNGKTIALRGDLKYGNPGTFDMTSTGTWDMQETADLDGSDYSSNAIAHLKVAPAGKTTTCTGSSSAKELTLGPGTFNGSSAFRFYPDADDKWHQDENNNLDGPAMYLTRSAAVGPLHSDGSHILLYVTSHSSEVISALGTWRLAPGAAPLTIYNYQTDGLMTLEMAEHPLVAGDITIGGISGRGPGKLDLGTGRHRISGTVAKHATGDATGNEIDFGSSYLELGDGSSIDMTNIGAANESCHVVAKHGASASISSFPSLGGGEKVHCHGVSDGGGNDTDSIDFDEHAHPGTLVMMGAGV